MSSYNARIQASRNARRREAAARTKIARTLEAAARLTVAADITVSPVEAAVLEFLESHRGSSFSRQSIALGTGRRVTINNLARLLAAKLILPTGSVRRTYTITS